MTDGKTSPKPTSLILDNLELNPYQYREHFSDFDKSLSIRMRVILSDAQYSDLGKLPEIVKVIRRGINDESREMELQEIAWSKSGDKIKEEIWLSDKEDKRIVPAFGWIGNLAFAVAEQGLMIDELLNTLVSDRVLKEEKIKEIKEKITREQNWLRRREFNRLRQDLDEFESLEEIGSL